MWRELYSSASAITNTRADLVMLAASQSNYANETAARVGWGVGGCRGLATRLVYRNYKQIAIHYGWRFMGWAVPDSEAETNSSPVGQSITKQEVTVLSR